MKKRRITKIESGFTMVELMAVLIIMGLLMTVVVGNFVGQVTKGRIKTTQANLRLLHQAVNRFKMDTGRFPTEDEGLIALVEQPSDVEGWEPGGYLDTTDIPMDGWNNEFIYEPYPESGKPFVIISYGADGEEGGEDENADLYSTDAY